MKGIIFTEFVEMVEEKYGYAIIDDIFESSDLPSGGIYTAVGTYKYQEMVQLLNGLSQRTKIPVNDLLKAYGKHLFEVLFGAYPHLFEKITTAFDLLEQIDKHLHVEVQRLYPDAELPKFDIFKSSEKKLVMIYQSERKMSDFADGVIEATLEHFHEKATVQIIMLEEDGSKVKFIISKE